MTLSTFKTPLLYDQKLSWAAILHPLTAAVHKSESMSHQKHSDQTLNDLEGMELEETVTLNELFWIIS